MKLWEICFPPRAENGSNLVDPTAVAEFGDLDAAVRAVALDGTSQLAAAGTEEGTLILWDIKSNSVLFSTSVSQTRRYEVLLISFATQC